MTHLKPSELSRFKSLPRRIWNKLSLKQRKIYLFHKRKRSLNKRISNEIKNQFEMYGESNLFI